MTSFKWSKHNAYETKGSKFQSDHNTQIIKSRRLCTGQPDQVIKEIPKLNSTKISYATTNTLLTSNNDQDIHPDDQHEWSLHRVHVDPNTTRVDHPSRQIHIAVRLQQPRRQWRKLAREPEALNRVPRPEGTDRAPFQKKPFQTKPCQTSQSCKGFKHKSNQRRAQKNQISARDIGTCSQASENDAKPRKSQQNFFNSW